MDERARRHERARRLDDAAPTAYLSSRGASSSCPLSEARVPGAGFRVSGGRRVTFFAYLDEFGHIGPYVGREDLRYRESPVFGLAGFVLPVETVRGFGSWFFQRKCELLAFEIERSGEHPALWGEEGVQPLHGHQRDPVSRAPKVHEPAVQQDRAAWRVRVLCGREEDRGAR